MNQRRLSNILFSSILTFTELPVYAVHLDIELKGENDRISTGFCLTQGVGCDLPGALSKLGLPPRTLPKDGVTGYKIFAADFADFPKPFDTANPGFNAVTGSLLPNELLAYRALGNLEYWHPTEKQWMKADAGVQIRLFGGLSDTQVITNPTQCGGFLICVPEGSGYEEGSTVFSATGISNSASLLIDNANSQGAFHTHLDWFLEKSSGEKGGPKGVYLVSLQLESNKRSLPSQPLLIAFNNGLSDESFAESIDARIKVVQPTPEPQPTPSPAPEQPQPTPGPTPIPTPEQPQPTPEPTTTPEPEQPQPTPKPAPTPIPEQSQPTPVITPKPVVMAERSFIQGGFKYEENAQEKLIGCPFACREIAQVRVSISAKVNLDKEVTAIKLAGTEKISISLGTHQYMAKVSEAASKKLIKAGLQGGMIKLAVKDLDSKVVGTLQMKWTGKQLSLSYLLTNTSTFATNFLSDPLSRRALLESVSVRLEDIKAELILPVKATPEFIAKVGSSRKIKRGGITYVLNTVSIKSRTQSR